MGKSLQPTERPALSPREQQILEQLWKGLQRKEIAAVLGLEEVTVKNYMNTMYHKLNVHTNVQIVRRGLELGLITLATNPLLTREEGEEVEWP